jgi:hypothetical protein
LLYICMYICELHKCILSSTLNENSFKNQLRISHSYFLNKLRAFIPGHGILIIIWIYLKCCKRANYGVMDKSWQLYLMSQGILVKSTISILCNILKNHNLCN